MPTSDRAPPEDSTNRGCRDQHVPALRTPHEADSLAGDALSAIARGDIPGISCVIIDGQVRVGRSRNTPLAKRLAMIRGAAVAGGGH